MTAGDEARAFAAWIEAQGSAFEAVVHGDEAEAFVSVLVNDGRSETASPASYRFAGDAQTASGTVSVDPVSGNTVEDARHVFRAVHLGGPPAVIVRAKAWAGRTSCTTVTIDGDGRTSRAAKTMQLDLF